MNNIISLPELSSAVANAVNCNESEAEELIRIFFSGISAHITTDGSIIINGLGTFRIIDNDVVLIPDPALANAINLPFASFESIELPDGLDLDNLDDVYKSEVPECIPQIAGNTSVPEETTTETISEPEAEYAEEYDVIENEDDEDDGDDSEEAEVILVDRVAPPSPISNEPTEITESNIQETAVPSEQSKPSSTNLRWIIAAAVIACIICFGGGYFIGLSISDQSHSSDIVYVPVDTLHTIVYADNKQDTDTSGQPSVTLPSNPLTTDNTGRSSQKNIITDTIRRTRFLTTMSRQHYGRMEFWVYIYDENAEKLGNPNNLKAGTAVIIPPAEKYGIDPNNPESVAKAIAHGKEIYARFN